MDANQATMTTTQKRILVVDDSVTSRRMVRFALAANPEFEVLEAESLSEALDLLSGQWVDLVVTDFHMPGGDGIELTRAVRALIPEQDLPILVISGDNSTAARQWAQAAGASAWIEKPFKPGQILGLIRNILL